MIETRHPVLNLCGTLSLGSRLSCNQPASALNHPIGGDFGESEVPTQTSSTAAMAKRLRRRLILFATPVIAGLSQTNSFPVLRICLGCEREAIIVIA